MKRRWLIRSIFMLPILLCIVGWCWSAGHGGWIGYYHGAEFVGCETFWGVVRLGTSGPGPGCCCGVDSAPEICFLLPNDPQTFLGFGYFFISPERHVYVPYWFLILAFSAILFFVWRKTRTKPQGGAFPVEVAAKPSGSSHLNLRVEPPQFDAGVGGLELPIDLLAPLISILIPQGYGFS